jgi:hypothetical protein
VHDDAPAGDDDPTGQIEHVDDPVEHEYVPATQGVHDDAPADDDDPTGHFLHSEAPAVSVYVPAKHNVHAHPAAE